MHTVIPANLGKVVVVRLHPGAELRQAIEEATATAGFRSAVIVSCMGSLTGAELAIPKADAPRAPGRGHEYTEIVTLSRPVSLITAEGSVVTKAGSLQAHLHVAVSETQGRTCAGHYNGGGEIFNTTELVLAEVDDGEGLSSWRHN